MAYSVVLAALQLLLLHRADGLEVTVAANHVTSLRATVASAEKLVPGGTRCLVGLSDGKFVAVIEPCQQVKRMLEDLK